MKRFFSLVSLALLVSCSMENNESTPTTSQQKSNPKDPKSKITYSYNEKWQYGDYKIHVRQEEESNQLFVSVLQDSAIVLADSGLVNDVDRVVVRDLDMDNLLEVYIVCLGGNAAFETIHMYEIGGGEIDSGDISKLYGGHHFYFTEDQLIHKNWLESDYGCCDFLGIEFVYFELIDNRFVAVQKTNWMHREGDAVNQSEKLDYLN